MAPNETLNLRHMTAASKENTWSDLLATFIEIDRTSFLTLLGLPNVAEEVVVRREVTAGQANRADIVLFKSGDPWVVLEAKVLAGLGPNQLDRYEDRFDSADVFVLLECSGLPVDASNNPRWRVLTWEQVLEAYLTSTSPWIRAIAQQWLLDIARQVPVVAGSTRWNDVDPESDLTAALKVRANWVLDHLTPPVGATKDSGVGGGGRSPVVRIVMETGRPRYKLIVEAQERLSTRVFSSAGPEDLLGPIVRVTLDQYDVETSRDFDWDLLSDMWSVLDVDPIVTGWNWREGRPSPKAEHDRTAYQALVERGGPKHVGFGFGEAQTQYSHECLFGVRAQLDAATTLADLSRGLNHLGMLLPQMATRIRLPARLA